MRIVPVARSWLHAGGCTHVLARLWLHARGCTNYRLGNTRTRAALFALSPRVRAVRAVRARWWSHAGDPRGWCLHARNCRHARRLSARTRTALSALSPRVRVVRAARARRWSHAGAPRCTRCPRYVRQNTRKQSGKSAERIRPPKNNQAKGRGESDHLKTIRQKGGANQTA